MNRPGTVDGDERIRLFCALRLHESDLEQLVRWQRAALDGVEGVRIVPAPNLHLTLAFLGHRPVGDVEHVLRELAAAASAAEPISLSVRRYRETRSVGMLTFDDAGERAAALARDLHARLERIGVYRPEQRSWLPHLTVVRFRRPPRLRPDLPELGAVGPSDAALYHSVLRSGGAQYEVIDAFALGGR